MSEVLELEIRRKIYDLIKKNPGIHLSKIPEILGIRKSLVEYHLLFMLRTKVINASKELGYSRFYVSGEVGVKNKKILSILRQEIPLLIVLYIIKNEKAKHKELIEHFKIPASTLSYHLNKLCNKEVVYVTRSGEDKGYSIINREEILKILIQYKPYNLIDDFKDVWSDLSVE